MGAGPRSSAASRRTPASVGATRLAVRGGSSAAGRRTAELGGARDRRDHIAIGRASERGSASCRRALRRKRCRRSTRRPGCSRSERTPPRCPRAARRASAAPGCPRSARSQQARQPPASHERQQHRLRAIVHRTERGGGASRSATVPAAARRSSRPPLDGVARAGVDRGAITWQSGVGRWQRRTWRRQPRSRAAARDPDGTPRAGSEQPADPNEGLEHADGVGPAGDPHEDQLAGHEQIALRGVTRSITRAAGGWRARRYPRRGRSSVGTPISPGCASSPKPPRRGYAHADPIDDLLHSARPRRTARP
jgi:hypothetical protein